MASEAEYERLYKEFVANGGGTLTLDGTNLTPKEYSDLMAGVSLTPEQQAALAAREEQYNRQSALNDIADEIEANTFTNPYAAVADNGIAAYESQKSEDHVAASKELNEQVNRLSGSDRESLIDGIMNAVGFGLTVAAGVSLFEKLAYNDSAADEAVPMYKDLKSHTNAQAADLPKAINDANNLASMREQFGEQRESCSVFNEIMGIMSGAFDGVLDTVKDAKNKITESMTTALGDGNKFFEKIAEIATNVKDGLDKLASGVFSTVAEAINDITSNVATVVNAVKDKFQEVFSGVSEVLGGLKDAIGKMKDKIAKEVSAFANMASELAKKAAALALAALTLDPCKMAVLTNTGSDKFKSAATKLNNPAARTPKGHIKTENDSRADEAEVIAAVEQAKASAETTDGVQQAPVSTVPIKKYSPSDSYGNADSGDNVQVIESVEATMAKLQDTEPTPKVVSDSQQVTKTIESGDGVVVNSKAFAKLQAGCMSDLISVAQQAAALKSNIKVRITNTENEDVKTELKIINEKLQTRIQEVKTFQGTAIKQLSFKMPSIIDNKYVARMENEKQELLEGTVQPQCARLSKAFSSELDSHTAYANSISDEATEMKVVQSSTFGVWSNDISTLRSIRSDIVDLQSKLLSVPNRNDWRDEYDALEASLSQAMSDTQAPILWSTLFMYQSLGGKVIPSLESSIQSDYIATYKPQIAGYETTAQNALTAGQAIYDDKINQ